MEGAERVARLASFRLHQSLVDKPLSIEEYWPIGSDKIKDSEPISVDAEMLAKIKRIHKIKK